MGLTGVTLFSKLIARLIISWMIDLFCGFLIRTYSFKVEPRENEIGWSFKIILWNESIILLKEIK